MEDLLKTLNEYKSKELSPGSGEAMLIGEISVEGVGESVYRTLRE
jgi:hypothetical protein